MLRRERAFPETSHQTIAPPGAAHGRSGARRHETHRHRLRGTWSRLDAARQTNVAKLAEAVLPLAPDGVPQFVCHLDGVGSGRGTGRLARALDRALGGALGLGLEATLVEAYRFLVLTYAPGDDIQLFGFSRGAYTARSLAGLIRACGILERAHADAVPAALARYRNARPPTGGRRSLPARHAAHVTTGAAEAAGGRRAGCRAASLGIGYLGVWDTVGALGVPAHLALAGRLNRGLGFHDTVLSPMVAAARHAVAIDERRRSFPPTLWDDLDALAATAPAPTRSAGFRRPRLGRRRRRRDRAVGRRAALGGRGRPRRRGSRWTRRRWRAGGAPATGAGRCRRGGRDAPGVADL